MSGSGVRREFALVSGSTLGEEPRRASRNVSRSRGPAEAGVPTASARASAAVTAAAAEGRHTLYVGAIPAIIKGQMDASLAASLDLR